MASSSTRSSKSGSALKARARQSPRRPLAFGSSQVRLLEPAFYSRDTLVVARELLGKILVTRAPSGEETSGRIVETEAYRGDDPASHSCRGQTPRSQVMFGPAGVAYVYFIYGMYEMLNFVTEREGYPGAVLIRALEPKGGPHLMEMRRGRALRLERLADGPGKLCRAMGIELRHNRQSLQGPELQVFDDGWRPEAIRVSPRVGIRVGTEALWRFYVDGNLSVSRVPQNALSRRI